MIKNKKHIIILISWIAVLLWMLLIFNLSSQVAEQSNSLSTGVTEVIVGVVEKVEPGFDTDISVLSHFLRKNAHFFAYLILGVSVTNEVRRSEAKVLRLCALALGICMLYAVSDEVHQLFVLGRGGQVRDVLIDSAGAIVGIGIYLLIIKTIKGDISGYTSKNTT
jgi:VanZ family protein